ncbi:MAG: LacI family DNA-binding transcriptional regulator [Solirubrobacteraceae bacterium]
MQPAKGIQEVAEKAGVSITTVSHALSGKGRIAPATRERIHRIAAELGYRPHASARNLAARKSGLLGLAVSQAAEQSFAFTGFAYFMQLMGAATKAALDQGYALVLVPPADKGGGGFNALPLDGAAIVDPIRNDPLATGLRSRGVPFVTTGRIPDGPADDYWVDNDHLAGTEAILQHLERSGARRIALITARPPASYAVDAIAAYHDWSERHGNEPLVVVTRGGLTDRQGFAAASELFDRSDPPDAIYATIDTLALGALQAARTRGLSVPDDVLIASCTDNDALRLVDPPLTALNLHPEEIGRRAIEMLVAIADGHEPPQRHVLVRSRVVARASTRRPEGGPSIPPRAGGGGRARQRPPAGVRSRAR